MYITKKGQKNYLPAYIPYIGQNYFKSHPRILCYAINQNLSKHAPWAKEWINRWAEDEELSYDRLNRTAQQHKPIPIKPYVEGFIPLVALIAMQKWQQKYGGKLPQFIDDVIAVTNFVKFSTIKDASSSGIPLEWWRECGERYSQKEIRILKPDLIIAFGQKTFSETVRILERTASVNYLPKVIYCRFPARIASNKGRPLSESEIRTWEKEIAGLLEKVNVPSKEYCHQNKMKQYQGYFVDMEACFEKEFSIDPAAHYKD